MRAITVVIRGRVQGVGFRDHLRRAAHGAGVAGWAVNRDDGTVECHLEGEEGPVERVLEAARAGPRGAEVSDADVTPAEPEGLGRFEVR